MPLKEISDKASYSRTEHGIYGFMIRCYTKNAMVCVHIMSVRAFVLYPAEKSILKQELCSFSFLEKNCVYMKSRKERKKNDKKKNKQRSG